MLVCQQLLAAIITVVVLLVVVVVVVVVHRKCHTQDLEKGTTFSLKRGKNKTNPDGVSCLKLKKKVVW